MEEERERERTGEMEKEREGWEIKRWWELGSDLEREGGTKRQRDERRGERKGERWGRN